MAISQADHLPAKNIWLWFETRASDDRVDWVLGYAHEIARAGPTVVFLLFPVDLHIFLLLCDDLFHLGPRFLVGAVGAHNARTVLPLQDDPDIGVGAALHLAGEEVLAHGLKSQLRRV